MKITTTIFVALLVLLAGCDIPEPAAKWSAAEIDPSLPHQPVYRKLDSLPEYMSVGDILEDKGPLRRSSDVTYLTQKMEDRKDPPRTHTNNCRSYMGQTDTLRINIGIGSGFGGDGFVILYDNGRFTLRPYHSTDTHWDGERNPVYLITRQSLSLDKVHYQKGDSLYGHIEFEAREITELSEWVKHHAVGYFRGKLIEYPR
ncbi:MAG TPA: hypothetical protein VGM89_17445 [Puia sp.]|jgi:hypothetical protein